ncbi:DUF7144 family membrane protein [Streptomyces rapamycinicus]|uniref:Membrane protein n=2 Tax=Streptomyces rapamycinicus TaxID=1226757 RepID=A0A3L8RLZ2_STRRN|nr:apolipoprotein N-acyltransferase [Streptomyces rapamycinicus]RLV80488.1 membrane protein [Streptomyces rapamycinicus NRRL 5491]
MASHAGGVQTGAAPGHMHRAVSGWLVFAGVMMIFGGLMNLLQGISAIRTDQVFLVTQSYIFQFDLAGWGWVHLALGIAVVIAGFAVFTGAMWARVTGVVLAGLALIANFLWLPYYPVWATVLLIIDALVIWALCAGPSRGGPGRPETGRGETGRAETGGPAAGGPESGRTA